MATYYVAATGSDSANGSLGTPWATFSHAATVVSQGDTVLGNGGDTITDNPVFTVGITIQSYGVGQCTIAGGATSTLQFSNKYRLC